MILFPAIDLIGGKVVRLERGEPMRRARRPQPLQGIFR